MRLILAIDVMDETDGLRLLRELQEFRDDHRTIGIETDDQDYPVSVYVAEVMSAQ